jgi:hypothetical protein
MNQLEKDFNEDMKNIYFQAKDELRFNASRFWQLVLEKGGVEAAKTLIKKEGSTFGFDVLREFRRLDLSVEAHVLKPKYAALFTEEEKRACRKRLEKVGYKPEKMDTES